MVQAACKMSEHCSLTMSESEGPGCYGRAHFLEQRLSLATQLRDPTRLQLGVSNLSVLCPVNQWLYQGEIHFVITHCSKRAHAKTGLVRFFKLYFKKWLEHEQK